MPGGLVNGEIRCATAAVRSVIASLQLERLRSTRQADLDEDAAGDPVRLVVGEPVGALDDDLVAHARACRADA